MQMIIVANWKLNLTFKEVKSWVATFNNFAAGYAFNKVVPVVCPSFIYISYLKENLAGARIGSQNISQFTNGAYTGEVSAEQLKDFAEYSIIGHSERRSHFSETDEIVAKKAGICLNNKIIPIICISKIEQIALLKDLSNILVAFEPLEAIGSKIPDNPQHIENMAREIIQYVPNAKVLYGGSVSEENVKSFSELENISGFLIGNESLNPTSFINIIKKCDM